MAVLLRALRPCHSVSLIAYRPFSSPSLKPHDSRLFINPRAFVGYPRNDAIVVRGFMSSSHADKAFQGMGDTAALSSEHIKGAPYAASQLLGHSFLGSGTLQRFGISSSASPQLNEKEINQSKDENGSVAENDSTSQNASQIKDQNEKESGLSSDTKPAESVSRKKRRGRSGTKQTSFSDSDAESDLSFDDLVKLVAEKEELLKAKHKEVEKMQDKVLRSYAEMENVIERTKREAENSKKFAIQNFAKSLLDVADNLARASSVVKDSFSKIDQSKKTRLVLSHFSKHFWRVFRKFGVEKFDPTDEQFDPNRHLAVFQVPDPSKSPGTVAVVLKSGYMLYDRVLRPAEVGVTQAIDEADQSSDA
ncbi:protein GrpE-like protein [Cinnamomum micranthum f. kanehirae]|uniref:GrpE protein homolog n=1 Tax=Cinnamomum micranthum f. kanehirae TaxID=337451 RepID=A0A443P4C3_9MAGN|nr:protein GrpE-like protein [Cinnamomum micranthum f. kanehirae]